jgi:hypothetical protein
MSAFRATLFIFLLLAVSSLAARAAPPSDYLAPDTEARWVPFELTGGNQIRFRTLLNGKWIDAILDTGVTDTAVSARFARANGMKPLVSGRADAIGGGLALSWTGLQRVEVGGLVRTGGRIAIINADPRVTGPAPVDLFVGSDILAAHALEIDYEARRFRLLPSGRLPFRGVTAPLTLAGPTRQYLTEVTIGARRVRPLIVDTGDGSMLTLTRTAWRGNEGAGGPVTTAIAYGMGGPVESELSVLPLVRLAGLPLAEVEARIEPDTGFSARKGTAGRIGSGLLRRHRILLDPGAGRMVIGGAVQTEWPLVRSTSGLMLAQDGTRLRVLHVMRASPAAAGGWRTGENICAVDGEAITPGQIGSWPIGAPGRTIRLGLCDGRERQLTLARFY